MRTLIILLGVSLAAAILGSEKLHVGEDPGDNNLLVNIPVEIRTSKVSRVVSGDNSSGCSTCDGASWTSQLTPRLGERKFGEPSGY